MAPKTRTNLVIIFGPPAVGKMTVGKELAKLTGYKLFHNHRSIEVIKDILDFSHPRFWDLNEKIRRAVFSEVAKSGLPGLIYTFVWAHDKKSDSKYIDDVTKIFKTKGGKVYYVELETNLAIRLKRNVTPYRLSEKESKRDTRKSEQHLLEMEGKHRMETKAGEFSRKPYVKINNTRLSAKKAATEIKRKLGL